MFNIDLRKNSIPTSQQYFNFLFPDSNFRLIYFLPKKISGSASFKAFQYKILNNLLYLNKMLFCFGKSPSSCFFCKLHEETLHRLPLSVMLKHNDKSFSIQNIFLIVFKLYVYNSRINKTLCFGICLHRLVKVKNLEKGVVFNNNQKHDMCLKKWSIVENLFVVIYESTWATFQPEV